MCAQFGLKRAQAEDEVRRVVGVVARWQSHFASVGVTRNDVDLLAEHIDRPFLREQRQVYSG
jgi:serine/threonine-protein kinase HipA